MTASLFGAAPLTAYAQTIPPLLQINPINVAAASNSDDDTVIQANNAEIKQDSETECEAKVSDDDKFQVGDNTNTAANDCDATQTATVAQANVNEDNDIQVAEATACQAMGLVAGVNICDNVITVSPPPPPEESVYCLETTVGTEESTYCFEDEASCEAAEDFLGTDVTEECAEFPEPPPDSFICTVEEEAILCSST
ncbi:MAG TPA: hypothetical protein VHF28_07855 [Nitrososphaera sp.]|nr:hypothetical protein [Nitrososphaera sp.]